MDMNRKTTTTKSAGFPNTDAPQAFREIAENGIKQAKEAYEKMSAATTDAVDLIKNSYSTAFDGIQDYNNKFIEFTRDNINAAFDFGHKVCAVNSPSAFAELLTEYARRQFRDADRADQATYGVRPKGDACDHGATQDGPCKNVQPPQLKLSCLETSVSLEARVVAPGFSLMPEAR